MRTIRELIKFILEPFTGILGGRTAGPWGHAPILREAEGIVDSHCSWRLELLEEADAAVTRGALRAAYHRYEREQGEDQ
jgi:hypothetical protein